MGTAAAHDRVAPALWRTHTGAFSPLALASLGLYSRRLYWALSSPALERLGYGMANMRLISRDAGRQGQLFAAALMAALARCPGRFADANGADGLSPILSTATDMNCQRWLYEWSNRSGHPLILRQYRGTDREFNLAVAMRQIEATMIVIDIDTLHHEAVQVAWQTGYEMEFHPALVDEVVANGIETGLRAIERKALPYLSENPLTQTAHGAAGLARVYVAAPLCQRDQVAKAVPVLTLRFTALVRRQARAPRSRQQNRRPDLVTANLFGDVDIDPASIHGVPMPIGLIVECCVPFDPTERICSNAECLKDDDRSVRAEQHGPDLMWTDGLARGEFDASGHKLRSRVDSHQVEIDASARLLCKRRRGQHAQVGAHEEGSEFHSGPHKAAGTKLTLEDRATSYPAVYNTVPTTQTRR
jgi:hypothetical protein